ncbi:MAG: hypothetical protein ACI3YK_04460 [Eubacteriales bacterium]
MKAMKNKVIALFLAGMTLVSCTSVRNSGEGVRTSAVGTDGESSAPVVTTKPKTPTPVVEFNYEKYAPQEQQPSQGDTDSEVPKYDVDIIADPILSGYSSLNGLFGGLISAPGSVSAVEGAPNLFDGYESSKYCLGAKDEVEVVWSMTRQVPLSAYALVTGNDTETYPDRNPISWELYGSADGTEDSWTLIDKVENTDRMPAANYAYVGFILDETVTYPYFRIVLNTAADCDYLQLSEIRLYTSDTKSAGLADSVAPSGCVSLTDMIVRSSISGPVGAGTHTVECLFDNLAESNDAGSNKYCVAGQNISVSWQMQDAVLITDYVVYTANDTESLPDRNPIKWTMYGSDDGSEWEEILTVENAGLPTTNYTPTAFETGGERAYRYYRLDFETNGAADCLQLSEVCLFTRESDGD